MASPLGNQNFAADTQTTLLFNLASLGIFLNKNHTREGLAVKFSYYIYSAKNNWQNVSYYSLNSDIRPHFEIKVRSFFEGF